MKMFKNRSYIEKLYAFLGISIFIHYSLVILFSLLLLIKIFFSREYKKILKDKSLILVEIVLGISIIMSLIYNNYYGLVAIPILFCIIVGRYYTLVINNDFKTKNLELISKISIIPFFTSFLECALTRGRAGYWFFYNPNYLGSVMMMTAIINLYLFFEKKSKLNIIIFILNISVILMSGSRSAIVAVIIGIFSLLYYFLERKYFISSLLFSMGYIAGVVSGIFPFMRTGSLIRYFWLRIDIIKLAFKIFEKKNILFGHGNFFYYKFTNFIYPHSHNAIVESLLSYGLIGTGMLMVVFFRYLYEIMKNDKKNVLKISLILGIIFHNFTDFTIFWIQTVLLFIMALSYKEEISEKWYVIKSNK
ncbi:MAG: O-antigen ligase family protein [Leptotrichiaceae bacterium]|nr:O-antigen ligase family protein [Leptotrichiaceae bacterium]MBP7739611.1 O-antigen ligase family protein [Leptotrichiaceae bacterium]MBP9630244.1 O-antigen ligase family protein [Leptotrichiaceae bacterium]